MSLELYGEAILAAAAVSGIYACSVLIQKSVQAAEPITIIISGEPITALFETAQCLTSTITLCAYDYRWINNELESNLIFLVSVLNEDGTFTYHLGQTGETITVTEQYAEELPLYLYPDGSVSFVSQQVTTTSNPNASNYLLGSFIAGLLTLLFALAWLFVLRRRT